MAEKFNEHERDELFRLALKLEGGTELEDTEKERWAELFPRFEALKAEKEKSDVPF